MIEIKLIPVTPELAAKYLAKNFQDNRNLRNAVVNQYVSDMTNGRWTQNGETIKFDAHGNLLDGQHRLHAVIISGQTIDFFVATGLPDNSATNIDIGAKRGAADALRIAGVKVYHTAQASLAKRILSFSAGEMSVISRSGNDGGIMKSVVTHAQIVDYVQKNDLSDFCNHGMSLYESQLSPILKPTDWMFLSWYLPKINANFSGVFLQKLATLEDIPATSPVRTLFKKLQDRLSPTTRFIEIQAAFDAFAVGRSRYSVNKKTGEAARLR